MVPCRVKVRTLQERSPFHLAHFCSTADWQSGAAPKSILHDRKSVSTQLGVLSSSACWQRKVATGRMKPSPYYERVVDVMEELVKFTLLTRDVAPYLVDRYSERRESAEELSKRVNLRSI